MVRLDRDGDPGSSAGSFLGGHGTIVHHLGAMSIFKVLPVVVLGAPIDRAAYRSRPCRISERQHWACNRSRMPCRIFFFRVEDGRERCPECAAFATEVTASVEYVDGHEMILDPLERVLSTYGSGDSWPR